MAPSTKTEYICDDPDHRHKEEAAEWLLRRGCPAAKTVVDFEDGTYMIVHKYRKILSREVEQVSSTIVTSTNAAKVSPIVKGGVPEKMSTTSQAAIKRSFSQKQKSTPPVHSRKDRHESLAKVESADDWEFVAFEESEEGWEMIKGVRFSS